MELSRRARLRAYIVSHLIVLLISQVHGLPLERNKEVRKNTTDNIIIQEKSGKLNLTFNEDEGNDTNAYVHARTQTVQIETVAKETAGGTDGKGSNDGNAFIEGEEKMQNDGGMELEVPTARIIVSVMKRSGRYWEPWELNYSK